MNLIHNRSLKQLLWIGIGSIIMFFAGLTSAYVVRKPQGNWVDFLLPDWFMYSTIIIVLSSVTLFIAKKTINNQKTSSNFILATFFLGALFSYFQFRGWHGLIETIESKFSFTKLTNILSSTPIGLIGLVGCSNTIIESE